MIRDPIYQGLLQSDLDCAGFNLLHFAGAPASNGIPAGGTAGQSLTKIDATDYNAQWSTVTGGSTALGQYHLTTATELLNAVNGTRYPIAAMATGTGNYFDSQSMDPCIIVNPNDSTQLIMLFTGMASPIGTGQQTIGRATASIFDPTTWTVSASPVMSASLSYETGFGGLRADDLLYNAADGKLYLFYTAAESSANATCALASSTDLGLTWTKLGQTLTPSAGEGTCSGLSVVINGTTMHGVYSYRPSGRILNYRYASASTSNWLSWTKGGADIYGDSGRDLEMHKLLKIGPTYLLVYESGSFASGGAPFDIRFATSSNPASTFTISPVTPFFVKSGLSGTFDQFHVATPCVTVINGYYYLFYCGAIDRADLTIGTHWQMGVTPLMTSFQATPVYIGTDARFVAISGGVKLEVRNVSTGAWVEGTRYTNP